MLPCFLGDRMLKKYDAIIIGGGASGLACAISAKNKSNLSLAIVEKNDRVGKKLLATGNGRCNLTNDNISVDKYTGSFRKQLPLLINRCSSKELLEFMSKLGLMTFADAQSRRYPLSKQASSVLDVLRFAVERQNTDLYLSQNIKSVKKSGGKFIVKTNDHELVSTKLVIACGSKAAPKLGGNSSGTDYLKNFGHTIIPFSPALCPVRVKSGLLKPLKGLRAAGKAELVRNGRTVKIETGEIQFSDSALSGICVFNLSLYTKKGDIINLDFLPDSSDMELYDILTKNKTLFKSLSVDNIFTGIFQKRLAQAVLKQSRITDFSIKASALGKEQLKAIARSAKELNFEVSENSGFDQAQTSLGGVLGSELDGNTMQSLVSKGLYVCGEAVDICGECGGYNLYFAFASGIIAGENL